MTNWQKDIEHSSVRQKIISLMYREPPTINKTGLKTKEKNGQRTQMGSSQEKKIRNGS